ncbi:nuclear pore complex protein NUP98A isoform X2 [Syzygium oleosum]|uniref:nuclear pore complex protein NUP98A isoform X2 n=1 Tax=Syzygium oleosum TaxID=219896 RepID=UPI0024BA6685|nr:nuclear pore complex protein NUP98A isoform X2 [Syzygium oleosum]
MFGGNNPFGQSSSSPFGSQSVFGQASNPTNPFAPKPFGSPNPFGTQTGSSMFGGTSTGVFGATQPSSPFSSTPAFGASSTPAFGSSSSAFGGSSLFGQKPAFGGFSSTPQTSPFGSTSQPSQPAFGSNVFGSSPTFGASSQSAFGGTSTPAFGSTSTPSFGATSTPAFGQASTPAFGATSTPAFGSTTTPSFGSTGTAFGSSTAPGGAFGTSSTQLFGSPSVPAFGTSNTPVFGASSTSAFGASSTPAFGASSTPAFGASSAPAFGASSTPAFGASSSPSFSFGSSPAFGQSTSAFGGSPFGATSSPFGSQIGAQATTPTFGTGGFGQSPFGGQRGGSRVAPYTPTTEAESGSGTQAAGKLESISAMPVYKDKSHEELRWEDYQAGDKGGPNPAGQSAGAIGFGAPSSTPSLAFGQSSPFASNTTSNPFASKPFGGTGFGSSATPSISPFASSTASATPSLFGSNPTPGFGASSSSSTFSTSGPSAFGSSTSIFSSPTMGSTQFGSGFTSQSTPLFSSTTPSFGQTGSAFGQSTSTFGQTASLFGQTTSPFGQTTTPSLGQTNMFSPPTSGFGGSLFPSTSSQLPSTAPAGFQINPSFSTPFQSSQPAQTTSPFGFGNLGQTQTAGTSVFGTQNMFGQSNLGNPSANLTPAVMQPVPATNPFGTLPAMPQVSIGRTGTSSSIQYGISSMPVVEKPAPVRISSLLTSRHLSQRRIRLPVRKYHPKSDAPKVPFFSEDEETPSTPKADALFIPRENPRALVIRPSEQWPSRTSTEKPSPLKDTSGPRQENGGPDENGRVKDQTDHVRGSHKSNGVHDDHSVQKGDSSMTLNGHRAGEAAIVYEHGADIEALMPKLRHSDYYTEPRIQELAAKERAEPGFCRRVKDFIVGRHGYGSIKFIGETDVRRLDLEALVQFNNREVIVYLDDNKKPPIGQGLNKPAEVTLLNIKCSDKKTGQQWTEGPKVEKYKEMLKKKAEDQGAEFVSYDPVKGVWKFKVNHFSKYKLEDEVGDWNVSAASES